MSMFSENEVSDDEEENLYFDLNKIKEHFKEMTPEKDKQIEQFEQVRNIANGLDKMTGMDELDKIIRVRSRSKRK